MYLDYKTLIHYLFPPSEDELRLQQYTVDAFSALYTPQRYGDITYLLPYQHPAVTAAIHLNKYHCHRHAQQLLATVLTLYLQSNTRVPHVILPIPLSGKRLRRRGYNQVHEVLKLSARTTSHITISTSLSRRRHTPAQTTLTRSKRLTNLQDAFAVKKPSHIDGHHLILLDDVVTTGATLRAAKAALLPHHPASITCVALAH